MFETVVSHISPFGLRDDLTRKVGLVVRFGKIEEAISEADEYDERISDIVVEVVIHCMWPPSSAWNLVSWFHCVKVAYGIL